MKIYACDSKELNHIKACLCFAKRLNLIDDDSLEAVEERCKKENEKREKMLKNNEIVYGVTKFSFNAYLQYELTRFKLEFAEESDRIKKVYQYKEITNKEQKDFYKNNKDLFTRYNKDRFFYREVNTIIHKKLREAEYENEINNILCKLS